jgi:hypothetical protein
VIKRTPLAHWKHTIFDNGSYKLVALFVTLILWVTILGRRDFSMEKIVDIEYIVPKHLVIQNEENVPHKLTVRVTGTRLALKKFAKTSDVVTIDLVRSTPGSVRQTMTPRQIDPPFGVKVQSLSPEVVNLVLISADGSR